MTARVPFYNASRTVNADLIVRNLRRHGTLVCFATEVPLERVYTTGHRPPCYMGDVMALFRTDRGHELVGVEVKDWGARVNARMARGYMDAYGRACQRFYLAANDFTQGVYSIKDLGLFQLDRREVISPAGPLSPDPATWRSAVGRLLEVCSVEVEVPPCPWQSTL